MTKRVFLNYLTWMKCHPYVRLPRLENRFKKFDEIFSINTTRASGAGVALSASVVLILARTRWVQGLS